MSFCSQCGAEMTPGGSFCGSCGKPNVDAPASAATVSAGAGALATTPQASSLGLFVNRYTFAALFVFIVIAFDLFSLMLMSQFGDRASEYGGISDVIERSLGHASAFLWLAVLCFAAAIVAVLRYASPFLFWWSIIAGLVAQKLAAIFVNPSISDTPQSFPIPMASAAAFWLVVAIVLAWPRIRLNRAALASSQEHGDDATVQGPTLWVMAGGVVLLFIQALMAIFAYLGWKDPNGQNIAFAVAAQGVAGQIYSHLQFLGSLHVAASIAALVFVGVSLFFTLRSVHNETLRWTILVAALLAQFIALANKLPMLTADAAPSDGSFPLGALALVAIFACPLISKQVWKKASAPQ